MSANGDVLEITYNHPTLGSGTYFPKSAEDTSFDPGGFRSSDDANAITGAGSMIDTINRTRWSFEGPVEWDSSVDDELESLRNLAASPVSADWTIRRINGSVYRGSGKPVGDIVGNGNAGTIALKLAGGGVMEKVAG